MVSFKTFRKLAARKINLLEMIGTKLSIYLYYNGGVGIILWKIKIHSSKK
jgi:hypothetical protein